MAYNNIREKMRIFISHKIEFEIFLTKYVHISLTYLGDTLRDWPRFMPEDGTRAICLERFSVSVCRDCFLSLVRPDPATKPLGRSPKEGYRLLGHESWNA